MSEEEGDAPTDGGEDPPPPPPPEDAPPAPADEAPPEAPPPEEAPPEAAPPEESPSSEEAPSAAEEGSAAIPSIVEPAADDGEEEEAEVAPSASEGSLSAAGPPQKKESKVRMAQDYDEDEGDDDDHSSGNKQKNAEDEGKGKDDKKRKHSISAHLQAELNKQKILRAKQDRENRRAELDTQHLYLMEIVATQYDMKVKDVEEFIIDSQDFVSTMNSFFEKSGGKSVIFSYQDADYPGAESGRPLNIQQGGKNAKMKRILVSNGRDAPIRGPTVFFLRLDGEKKISMKNINDEVFFGMFDIKDADQPGFILEAVQKTLSDIFLKNLKTNTTWISITDPETANLVRLRFLNSVDHYSEFLADSYNDIASRLDLRDISDMENVYEKFIKTADSLMNAAKDPETVARVEHTVVQWCKNIERVLATSKQMRKETDTMGPYAELAYWRNLMAKMCFIIQQVQQLSVVSFINVLNCAKSRVLKRWKDVDSRVTDEYHEAKDSVRYMYALEKFCEPLYQTDPPGMIQHINSMMYVIRTIHTTSRYYNTCEKVTALMVKISNQMVAACRRYLTKDGTATVWSQEKGLMLEKLNKCIELYETYRGSYEATKAELEENPDGKRFNFSVNNIFGRFETFCERLKKIIQIVEIFNLYNPVHDSHIDGLEEISKRLHDLQDTILQKTYDPLEFRKPDFDIEFVEIRSQIDDIQRDLEAFMDKAIEGCSTCMHGLILLERFRNLLNRCLDVEGKNWYLFQFYHNEIELILSIYEAEKNETPIPRGYPPFAGKIAWSRHLYRRLERPMKWFQEKTTVLKKEEAKITIKLFNTTCKKLLFYEMMVHDSWIKQCNSVYDALESPILTLRGTVRQELVLNFDPFFRQIIEETEIIRKLDLEVPDIALIVYYKQDQIFERYERIKGLLERFLLNKFRVPTDLAVLMRPLMKKVEKSFMPGVTNINWTSLKAPEYFDFIEIHQKELEETIGRTLEIISIRINQSLHDISHTMMIDLPEERPLHWPEYMERIKRYGVIVAKELEYKSRLCEQAVVDLINMLLSTCDMPTPSESPTLWLTANSPVQFDGEETAGVERPPVDPSIIPTQMTKDEQTHIYEECRHVFGFYNLKCIEALQKTTRISLDIVRSRTEEPQVSKRNPGKILNRVPLLTADLILTIPTINIKPQIADMQQILNKSISMIMESLKRVIIWGQRRTTSFDATSTDPYYKDPSKQDDASNTFPRLQPADAYMQYSLDVEQMNARLKNCFKPVMEYKDISKMVLIMQTAVVQSKQKVTALIATYQSKYCFLWKETRDEEIKEILDADPVITEIEAIMRGYRELEQEVEDIPAAHRVGPMDVLTKEMKMGFSMEIKEWKLSLCRQMSDKFKVKALEIAKFIDECNKDLNTPLKDMNDIRYVMTVLEKIRDKFVDYDMGIRPIEECYSFLNHQKYKVPDEESNRADTLRYNFNKLQTRALEVQSQICNVQEKNKTKLLDSVAKFKDDLQRYLVRYHKSGPMVEGLAPQIASDRLVLFQDEFDELFERYQMYNAAEKLFGFIPTDYPEIRKLQRELALLQKLYGLYNDVMRSVNNYYEIRWNELKIPKINPELVEFKRRCSRLPKALHDWPAYSQLKKTIEDFHQLCPLLDMMTNKCMKDRHWDGIGDIVDHMFLFESENFSLKHVMEAPLLKHYDAVEDICLRAFREKEIEGILKQTVLDWSVVPLLLAHYKNRGEILLREYEAEKVCSQLEVVLAEFNDLLQDKYSSLYRRELHARIADFTNVYDTVKRWLKVQDLWLELGNIFVGADIARQLPLEAKKFQNVDRSWVKLMGRARENPFIVGFCNGDELVGQLVPFLEEQLDFCVKSLREAGLLPPGSDDEEEEEEEDDDEEEIEDGQGDQNPKQSIAPDGKRKQSAGADGKRKQSASADGKRKQSASADGKRKQSASADGKRKQSVGADGKPKASVAEGQPKASVAEGQPRKSVEGQPRKSVEGQPRKSVEGQPRESNAGEKRPSAAEEPKKSNA